MAGAARSQAQAISKLNGMKQVLIAGLNYEVVYRHFPYNVEGQQKFNNDLSWRVRVLPFLEMNELAEKMDVTKGPDESPNVEFADQTPEFFQTYSSYVWIVSEKPVKGFPNITDGSSNTVCLIEYPTSKSWLENESASVDEVVKYVTSLPDGKEVIVGFYDGSVRTITNAIDEETLRAILTPQGGEIIQRSKIK